jgi:alpha-beta hydrolase superfamily lysophospholipase
LLDPRDIRAQARMTRFGVLGVFAKPLSGLIRGKRARRMIPMRWIANMSKMSRDPAMSRLCAADPRGGGARVPLGFLTSYLRFRHTPPARMGTPILLAHPSLDGWTPVELSARVLERAASPTRMVMLRECGHFPIEEPGLTDMFRAIDDLVEEVNSTRRQRA